MSQSLIAAETDGPIAVLTLNHPEKRNALSRCMLEELRDVLKCISADKKVKVVILRANGPVFSAGHDLRELDQAAPKTATALFALCTQVMEAIRLLPQPVIAQVDGLATAAGCQLAATCDLVVASERASFATPGVKIGLFCATPAVALSRALSHKKALEMLLTGEAMGAQEALACGLINRVVASDKLAGQTLALARQIASASGAVLSLGKRAFYEQLGLPRPAAYKIAEKTMTKSAGKSDAREGIKAFLEKRQTKWDETKRIS